MDIAAQIVALAAFVRLPSVWRGYPPDMPDQLSDPVTGIMWVGTMDPQKRLVRVTKRENPFDTAKLKVTTYEITEEEMRTQEIQWNEVVYKSAKKEGENGEWVRA